LYPISQIDAGMQPGAPSEQLTCQLMYFAVPAGMMTPRDVGGVADVGSAHPMRSIGAPIDGMPQTDWGSMLPGQVNSCSAQSGQGSHQPRFAVSRQVRHAHDHVVTSCDSGDRQQPPQLGNGWCCNSSGSQNQGSGSSKVSFATWCEERAMAGSRRSQGRKETGTAASEKNNGSSNNHKIWGGMLSSDETSNLANTLSKHFAPPGASRRTNHMAELLVPKMSQPHAVRGNAMAIAEPSHQQSQQLQSVGPVNNMAQVTPAVGAKEVTSLLQLPAPEDKNLLRPYQPARPSPEELAVVEAARLAKQKEEAEVVAKAKQEEDDAKRAEEESNAKGTWVALAGVKKLAPVGPQKRELEEKQHGDTRGKEGNKTEKNMGPSLGEFTSPGGKPANGKRSRWVPKGPSLSLEQPPVLTQAKKALDRTSVGVGRQVGDDAERIQKAEEAKRAEAVEAEEAKRVMRAAYVNEAAKMVAAAKSTEAHCGKLFAASAKAYRRGMAQGREAELKRRVQSLLNKIAPDNLATIACKIGDTKVVSSEELKTVIALIMKKALAEPHYCETYADLVCRLMFEMPEFPSESDGKPVTFKSILLIVTQDEYKHLSRDSFDITEEEKEGKSKEELDLVRKKRKDRCLATMRFIGHLFLRKLLSSSIIGQILRELAFCGDEGKLKLPGEHILECICELLNSIGYTLDTEHAGGPTIEQVYGRLSDLQQLKDKKGKGVYPRRIQFMIRDVIETRAAGWQKKSFKAAAKTKEEIRQAQCDQRTQKTDGSEVVILGQRPIWMIATAGGGKSGPGLKLDDGSWQGVPSKSRR